MRRSPHLARVFLLLALGPCLLLATTNPPDVISLIKKVDELYRSQTSEAKLEMRIETPHWKRTLQMEMWTKKMDQTFITITSPKKDRGISTLRKQKEMWNYFPKINKIVKVPPSMMMGSWMGSDFTNDDLVKETTLLDDYNARILPSDKKNSKHYIIELVPKAKTPTVWGKILVTIQRSDLIPLSQSYFDEKGKHMREMTFKEIKTIGGRKLPVIMEMVSINKKNTKTIIRYLEARFDQQLRPGVFTLRNLRKQR